MGVTVRTDRRTSMLYLDIHSRAKRKRVFTGLPDTPKNRTVLQTKAEQIEREIFLGIFDASKHFSQEARKQRLTFRQLAAEWCKKKQNEVAPLTFEWYVEVMEGSILPFWGAKRVEDVSPTLLDAFKATLLSRKLAPRTINIILSRLKDMLRMAYERGHIAKDVSRWVALQRQRRPDIEPLSFEEKERLLKALPLRWRPYFVVAFGTGLRPSEQIALTWDRIDLKEGKIAVREGWRRGQATALKVASANRDVDILPSVRKALEAQRLVPVALRSSFRAIVAGISMSRICVVASGIGICRTSDSNAAIYTTRGTPFATHALASGEDPGWVAKMLGHTTLLMLTTRYYRYIPNLTRRDGSLLARRLDRKGGAR